MMKKIFLIVILVIILIMSVSCEKQASMTADNVMKGADDFLNSGNGSMPISESAIKSINDNIFNILTTIGIVVSVLSTAIVGILILTSSIEKKAEYKEKLTPLLIGSIVIFAAFTIWKILIIVLQGA